MSISLTHTHDEVLSWLQDFASRNSDTDIEAVYGDMVEQLRSHFTVLFRNTEGALGLRKLWDAARERCDSGTSDTILLWGLYLLVCLNMRYGTALSVGFLSRSPHALDIVDSFGSDPAKYPYTLVTATLVGH